MTTPPASPPPHAAGATGPGWTARALGWALGVLWLLWSGRQVVPTLVDRVPPPEGPVVLLAILALGAGVMLVFGRVRAGAVVGAVVVAALGARVAGVFGPAAPVRTLVTLSPQAAMGVLAVLAGAHALALALAWPVGPRGGTPAAARRAAPQ
jgi:hypothetical protein